MPKTPPSDGGEWRLVPYIIAPSGRCPVLEFLEVLHQQNARAYIEFYEHWKPAFEEHGPFRIGPPHWVGLRDDLYEIRWCGPNRIYCSVEPVRRVMMYMGVVKTWPKFKREHRKICNQRRADVREDYDEESRGYLYDAFCRRRGTS